MCKLNKRRVSLSLFLCILSTFLTNIYFNLKHSVSNSTVQHPNSTYKIETYVNVNENPWLINRHLLLPTGRRNHDCFINNTHLITFAGRYAHNIESYTITTQEWHSTPFDDILLDLNHVVAVTVDKLPPQTGQETWIPCGFHNDRIGREKSVTNAFIIDLQTLSVTKGPKLLVAGGACGALPLFLDGPNKPAHICSFGGTDGSHNRGTFLNSASCYDRMTKEWHQPFGSIPVAFDHANAVYIPNGICHKQDPAHILIMNFRTKHYGTQTNRIYAFDIHVDDNGVLSFKNSTYTNKWYLFADVNTQISMSRDASGVVVSSDGRYVFNFGGVHYDENNKVLVRKGKRHWYFPETTVMKEIRAFDVCDRQWRSLKHNWLNATTYAIQTCAYQDVIALCGGQCEELSPGPYSNKTHSQTCNTKTLNQKNCQMFSMRELMHDVHHLV